MHHLSNEMHACGIGDLTIMEKIAMIEAFRRDCQLTLGEQLAKLVAMREMEYPDLVV